jgi:hypothetical protein
MRLHSALKKGCIMKKILLALFAVMILAFPAMAGQITINSQVSTTAGGLFNVTTDTNGSFGTFCVETNEYLGIGGTYSFNVSDAARYNNDTPSNSDPISKATAWLFTHYSTVAGYANNATENGKVQQAIWLLENEAGGSSNAYYLAATTGDQAGFAALDANGAYGVHVMNLYADGHAGDYNYRQQDLLMVPDSGLTVMLLGLGVSGLTMLSRKFRA